MTNEEAIKWLDEHALGRLGKGGLEAKIVAIKALEKQIPKKPIDLYFDKRCPNCENLWGVKKGQKFCDKCGQALEWEDDK